MTAILFTNQKGTHFNMLCYLDFIAEFFAPYALASFPCIRGVSRLYNEALNSPKIYGTLIEKMDAKNVFFIVIHSIQCSGSGKKHRIPDPQHWLVNPPVCQSFAKWR
jgi:hypothetical protein